MLLITSNALPPGLSLALGTATVTPLQMAQAYAVFANGGLRIVPFIIDSIRNSQDQVIYQAKPLAACSKDCPKDVAQAPRAISPQNAFLITSALHDVIERGTAKLAKNLGRNDLSRKIKSMLGLQDTIQISLLLAGWALINLNPCMNMVRKLPCRCGWNLLKKL
jgi:membrane carboxypeptidase/penicillin-binding protein